MAAIALAMAAILDNPRAIPQQPAAGRLVELLSMLAKQVNRRGKLAAVRSMTDR